MAGTLPEIQGLSIVAVGSFNPAIFQPQWFARTNLIRPAEADIAKVQLIHREVCAFTTVWFRLQVTTERFSLETSDPTMSRPLRDLAVGTFAILEHTPVKAFGFNSNRHYKMESEADWHAFGHCYAPKAPWNAVLLNPGTRSVAVNGTREQSVARVEITVEPSVKVTPHGVYIGINENYTEEAVVRESLSGTPGALLKQLKDSWDGFVSYADSAAEHLLTYHRTKN